MRKLHTFSVCFVFLILFGFQPVKAFAQGELIQNGSFETGDFTGWTVINEQGGGGNWFVYSGTLTPISGITVLPPPDGAFAAITDQTGGGSHLLFQDISIPQGATVTCSAVIYYENSAEDFFAPDSLSSVVVPNQQARVDILRRNANPFTVSDGVLLNVFQTLPGDPLSLGYTTLEFDLSEFAGSQVRLRVAEVDNQLFFNFSIDEVSCIAEGGLASSIPTLGEWGMIAMAGVLGLAG
ncbi:MAG TPA: IPTL-CTERM sorting domain-containing protein, partial [Thermodesulfobacteriota bacterium]|nr:IPTL-CTERM sorting domain-containing protein [Thermodesulfobacteriota bacterium]